MRFYTQPYRFYCGVDLHARTLESAKEDGRPKALRRVRREVHDRIAPRLPLRGARNELGPSRDESPPL